MCTREGMHGSSQCLYFTVTNGGVRHMPVNPELRRHRKNSQEIKASRRHIAELQVSMTA